MKVLRNDFGNTSALVQVGPQGAEQGADDGARWAGEWVRRGPSRRAQRVPIQGRCILVPRATARHHFSTAAACRGPRAAYRRGAVGGTR
jgi:hypothetical protein